MNLRSKALTGVAMIALLAGCGMFKSDNSSPSASSSSSEVASNTAPSTVPSANEPPMTKTSPVEGGAPASASTAAPQGAAPAATAGIALSEVENPKQTLAKATVKDVKGEAVGEVKSIRVGKDGKVAAVNVTVGKRTVALKPDTLTYVQAENTIQSQQSKDEIAKAR
jgi:hypothetical protein